MIRKDPAHPDNKIQHNTIKYQYYLCHIVTCTYKHIFLIEQLSTLSVRVRTYEHMHSVHGRQANMSSICNNQI